MKNDSHKWDNRHPTAQMLGRWQPWHAGHQKLFEEILKKMADFPKESENIVLPESSQVPELVKSEISEIFEDNETKVEEEIGIILPIEEAKGEEVGEKVIEVVEEEEVDVGGDQAELDEPLGLGLKFDEIEEMIDEVLSMEN